MADSFWDMFPLGSDADPLDESGTPIDIDGDGIIDGMEYQTELDLDGDGINETIMTEQQLDLDGDGITETASAQIHSDFDLDGDMDYQSDVMVSDLDGDGTADYMVTSEDYDGDGIFEATEEFTDADGDGIFDSMEDYSPILGGEAPAYAAFDPSTVDPDSIIGDPAGNMENWHWQETGTSCAVASQEFVLEQLTGQEFDESDLRELAEENGWYDAEGGTPMDDMGNILEYMGLQVEQSTGNSVEDIEHCLENGGQIIVGVDSDELWNGTNDELFGPGMDADHAVQVTGIDYSNPEEPMIILNDPGTSNGGGAMVPLEAFVDAWEDSGCFMVAAYA